MYFTYVLYSSKYDKIYVGYTSNLEKRLAFHNKLSNKGYTKRYRPWKVVYTECFETKEEAMKREKALKGGQGRAWIWREILGVKK